MSQHYSVQDLTYLMARLRDPETGCPWDKEQTFATIVPYTLEEAYEVADTIEREDWPHLKDELGDLLFQVIYYAQMADEKGWFKLEDVVHGLTEKMVRRHPHVFENGHLYETVPENNTVPSETDTESAVSEHGQSGTALNTVADTDVARAKTDQQSVKQNWEAIKAQEKAEKGITDENPSILADVPVTLPALSRAAKLQKRASRVGFDWPDIQGVLDKIREELDEVQEAVDEQDMVAARKEYGDLLFASTNLTRFLKQDPETALRGTNRKFEQRFRYIEQKLSERALTFDDVDLAQMDAWWDEAKALE